MKKLLLVIGFVGCLLLNAFPASAEQMNHPYGDTNMNANTSTNTNNYRATATDDNRRGFDWGWLGLLGLFGLAGARNRSREGVK